MSQYPDKGAPKGRSAAVRRANANALVGRQRLFRASVIAGKVGAQYAKPSWDEFPIPAISPANNRKLLKDLNVNYSLK
jgi:hypothetical protein